MFVMRLSSGLSFLLKHRACRETGALTDVQTALALKMVDDRNLTAHTYNEEIAVKIFAGLSAYCELMRVWMENIAKKS